jgi:hypothetical protein
MEIFRLFFDLYRNIREGYIVPEGLNGCLAG